MPLGWSSSQKGERMNDIRIEIGMILFGVQVLLLTGFLNIIEEKPDIITNTVYCSVMMLAFLIQIIGIINLCGKK